MGFSSLYQLAEKTELLVEKLQKIWRTKCCTTLQKTAGKEGKVQSVPQQELQLCPKCSIERSGSEL